ncbi:hypothetical protein BX666DRAFT_1927689 [Dichotomocladium elegans]|nr:hypothetical protein BX666DRAFT_1927689 [Dichotomocladium elegans]
MLNEDDDILGNGFLDPDASRYLLGTGTSSSINRSLSMPIQLGNPWDTDSQFGDHVEVADIGPSSAAAAVDDDMLGDGVTAASVLVGIELPEIYDQAYMRARPVGERVTLDSLEKVMALAELPARTVQEIQNMVVPPGAMYVTHNEFNTATALMACAQKNMEVSLQNVYLHRNDLPSPVLLNLDQLDIKRALPISNKHHIPPPPKPVDDPWAMPDNPNGAMVTSADGNGKADKKSQGTAIQRTIPPSSHLNDLHSLSSSSSDNDDESPHHHHHHHHTTPTLAGVKEWFLELDAVEVTEWPEREGFIFFKHVNYEVASRLRQVRVVRRYSDFYWLWEVLLRRYPLRMVPHLPPKKMSGKDETFMKLRQRGLKRFINAIVQHPTLKRDDVVEQFLTHEEFGPWRRANSLSHLGQEEFVRDQALCCSIPRDLDMRIDIIRKRLPALIDHYTSLCSILERQIELYHAQNKEFVQYSNALKSMSELEQPCYIPECQSCPMMVQGYESVAKYIQHAGGILDNQAQALADGIVERLKQHRELYLSFKDMLERKEKLLPTQTEPQPVKRNSVKDSNPDEGLEDQHDGVATTTASASERAMHIRYCVTSELSYIHKHQAFVSHMYQKYVQEQFQFSRHLGDNWKALHTLAIEMPINPDEFV